MSSPGSDPPSHNQPFGEPSDISQGAVTHTGASHDQPSNVPSGSRLQDSGPVGELSHGPPLDEASGNPPQAPDTLDSENAEGSDSASVNSDSPMCPSPGKTYQGHRRRPAISTVQSPLLEGSPNATSPRTSRREQRGSPVYGQRTIYSSSSTRIRSSPRQAQSASSGPYPPSQFRSTRSQSSAAKVAAASEAAEARQSRHEVPYIHPHSTPPLPQPPLPRSSSANIRDQEPIPRPLPPYELRVDLISYDQAEDLFHEHYHLYYKPVFEQLRREMQYLQGKFDMMNETMLENRRILDRLNTFHEGYAQREANYPNQHQANYVDQQQVNYTGQHYSQVDNQYSTNYGYTDPSTTEYSCGYNYSEQNSSIPKPEPSPTNSDQNHSYNYYKATYHSDSDEEKDKLKKRGRK